MKRLIAVAAVMFPAAALAFEPTGLVVFMSDFGVRDDAVALCKGIMLAREPALRIVDLTHDVTAFDIREGAFYLEEAARTFPAGTVFVGVIDPGVGTERRAIVAETANGQLFVAPDNGLLTHVLAEWPLVGAWEITNPAFAVEAPSTTFHGRDLFSPSGAVLAAGQYEPADAGPSAERLVTFEIPTSELRDGAWHTAVLLLDKAFGNVWTDLTRAELEARGPLPTLLHVWIGDTRLDLPLVATFGDVPEGRPLAYFNSRERLSFAINMGNFAAAHSVSVGQPVTVELSD